MIRQANGRGVSVLVGTLLPQRAGGSRAGGVTLIEPTNDQIRDMASQEHAVLVDLYKAFGGSPDPWIDYDGLHPTEAGHRKIAETFFSVLRMQFGHPVTN
jgi:lysophospholipase L1-like esterase